MATILIHNYQEKWNLINSKEVQVNEANIFFEDARIKWVDPKWLTKFPILSFVCKYSHLRCIIIGTLLNQEVYLNIWKKKT